MSDTEQTTETSSTGAKIGVSIAVILVLGWFIGGIIALIMSIVCFGLSGSTSEKVIGLLIAFILGPLYFIFYGVNKSYCRNLGANVSSSVAAAYNSTVKTIGGRK